MAKTVETSKVQVLSVTRNSAPNISDAPNDCNEHTGQSYQFDIEQQKMLPRFCHFKPGVSRDCLIEVLFVLSGTTRIFYLFIYCLLLRKTALFSFLT